MRERSYGDSRLTGGNEKFFDQPLTAQLEELAFSHGCPIPREVVLNYGGGRKGTESAIQRYAECNFVFREIVLPYAETLNPALHARLSAEYPLAMGESAQAPEHPARVPKDYGRVLSGAATPWGYSIPRILIEQFGRGEERTRDRYVRGLDVLEEALKVSSSVEELVARLAEVSCQANAKPEAVLSHVFAAELSGYGSYFEKLKVAFGERAPQLAQTLAALPEDEKRCQGIAVF